MEEQFGLQQVPAPQPRPGKSRDAVISAMENSDTRPVADPCDSSLFRNTPPRTPQQQNDLDEDMDQMIAEIMDSGDESKETLENKFKKLQKKASALRDKKKSFDSENSSPLASIKASVHPRAESKPPAGVVPKESQPQLPEDPDKIIALPHEEGGASGGPSDHVLEDVPKVKKKEAASTSSSVRRRHGDHVAIEMGFIGQTAEGEEQRNPTYLETYLGYLFNCCLSPFRPDGYTGGFWGYCVKFCFVQVIIYWAVTITAILETLAATKLNFLKNVSDSGLENFTNMCFFIMNTCLKIYSAYLFTMQQQKFAKMLRSYARLRSFAAQHSNVEAAKYQTWKVTLLVIVSMAVSVLSVVFASGTLEWTIEDGILEYAFRISLAVFVWTPEGASKTSTQLELLYTQYGQNMTGKKAMMGLLGFGTKLCTRIIANAMSDLVLVTASTIEKEMGQVAKDVGNTENDIYPVTMASFEAEDGQWAHYQLLQQAVNDTNDTLDCLLKYIHADNLMLFVYFVMNIYDNEFSFFTAVHFLYNIVKIWWAYRIGNKAAEKNDTYETWIRRLIWKSNDKNFTTKAYVILDGMKRHPLGLGRGQFLIDEGFLFRFVGGFGSVFVLQAQARDAAAAAAAGATTTV